MKQIWKWIIVIPIVVGIVVAVLITFKNQANKIDEQNKLEKLFGNVSSKPAEVTAFYTYGTSFNVEGKIKGISKENFEGMKLILTDGIDFEKSYRISCSFEDGATKFSTKEMMNAAVDLEELVSR